MILLCCVDSNERERVEPIGFCLNTQRLLYQILYWTQLCCVLINENEKESFFVCICFPFNFIYSAYCLYAELFCTTSNYCLFVVCAGHHQRDVRRTNLSVDRLKKHGSAEGPPLWSDEFSLRPGNEDAGSDFPLWRRSPARHSGWLLPAPLPGVVQASRNGGHAWGSVQGEEVRGESTFPGSDLFTLEWINVWS